MPVQWLGFRPDVRPQHEQADTARMAVQLREQEVTDRRADLEQALEQQQFKREMEMFNAEKDIWRDTMFEEGRNVRAEAGFDRAELLEEGRDTRAAAVQERLITADERKAFKDWWEDASEEAQQAVLDNPEGARVAEDSFGFPPVVGKEKKTLKMTDKELKQIEKDIKKEMQATDEGIIDRTFWSPTEEKELQKRMSPYRESFRSQWPGVGETRGDADFSVGSTHVKGGKTWIVTGHDADGEPIMDELGAKAASGGSEPAGEKRKTGADREKRNIFRVEE